MSDTARPRVDPLDDAAPTDDPAAPLMNFLGAIRRRYSPEFEDDSFVVRKLGSGSRLTVGDLRNAVRAIRDQAISLDRLQADNLRLYGELGSALARAHESATVEGETDLAGLRRLYMDLFRRGDHEPCVDVEDAWREIRARREEVARLTAELDHLRDELAALRAACARDNEGICQALGQAMGYPWFADDPVNFPGATAADGVCVGEHVAASLAMEAADRIRRLQGESAALRDRFDWVDLRDAEIARDRGGDDFDDEDADEWAVTVWVAGRGRTSYGPTLVEAIGRAMEREREEASP